MYILISSICLISVCVFVCVCVCVCVHKAKNKFSCFLVFFLFPTGEKGKSFCLSPNST